MATDSNDPKFQVSRDLLIRLHDLAASMKDPVVTYNRDREIMFQAAYDKRGEALETIRSELAALIYYV